MKLLNFKVQLVLRLSGLFLAMLLLAYGIVTDVRALGLVALGTLTVLQAIALVRFINHTNRELESFLDGLKFGDFQQTYTIAHLGPSFRALEKSLHVTVDRFKELRVKKEQEAIYNRALVQHIPIPFFIVHGSGRVEVLNNAIRRTFNVADIANTDELAQFGASFQRDVLQVQPGEALLTTVELSGTDEYFIMTATQLTFGGRINKLVSLQNVQGELDATELATWQNLLRVTSHEILNSLTPISSCTQTARSIVDQIIESDIPDRELREDLDDVRESLSTVLSRSEGVIRFIQNYRQLSRTPRPQKMNIPFASYFHHLESLLQGEIESKNIDLNFHHMPQNLYVDADESMLDQMLINLVRNAVDAVDEIEQARISIVAYRDGKHRTVVEVQDNGKGIAPDMAEKLFTPFFTTKSQGSGVGLALVRYTMLAHGGTATYTPGEGGGTIFRLVF